MQFNQICCARKSNIHSITLRHTLSTFSLRDAKKNRKKFLIPFDPLLGGF
jgi:hypothetical protein